MDPLHATAAAYLRTTPAKSEDEFYNDHSIAWLHSIKSVLRKIRQLVVRHKYDPARHPKPIEL